MFVDFKISTVKAQVSSYWNPMQNLFVGVKKGWEGEGKGWDLMFF